MCIRDSPGGETPPNGGETPPNGGESPGGEEGEVLPESEAGEEVPGGSGTPGGAPAPVEATTAGSLPFTGSHAPFLLVVALGLIGLGTGLRRVAADRG